MSLFIGCGTSTLLDVRLDSELSLSHPAIFSRAGSGEGCPDECVPESIRFACGALGTCASKFQSDYSLEQVLLHLNDHDTIPPGKARLITVRELLEQLADLPPFSAVLVHSSGHLWVVIDEVEIDGEKLVQLVHGDEAGMLVSKQDILDGEFREAWQIDHTLSAISIKVGSGSLDVDAVAKNLGVVKAGVQTTAVFTLKNSGHSSLRVVNAGSSCSCTTSSLEGNSQLEAGNSYDLAVTLHPNNLSSQRQQILLEIHNLDDGTVMQQRLTVFASQREPLPVLPSTLDFGAVVSGGSSTRVVRVREVETLRFGVTTVTVADMPLTHLISQHVDQHGLATYQISFQLHPASTAPGKYQGFCLIGTTSRTHPQVRVPVQYEILPTVTVEPQSLAIGTVNVKQPQTSKLRIRSALQEKLTVHVLQHPRECSIQAKSDRDGVELNVTTTLTDPGVWQDEIVIQVQTDSGSQELSVRSTGLAR